MIARATDPPIWRKKVRFDVATPSSWKGTAFWTMIVKLDSVGPMPRPTMSIQNQSAGSGVSAVSWVIMRSPTAIIRIPPTVSHL